MVRVAGKVALVTGGARGIGAACARRLADAGARVVILDLDELGARQVAEEVAGRSLTGDVADPDTLSAAVASVEKELGRLDLVYLNSGLGSAQRGLDDSLDVTAYRRLMGINVDHVVFGLCAAVPALRRAGGGTVVVTASLAGLRPMPADPLYTASKHAVVGYVRAAGAALAWEGIRVVAFCPPLASPEQVANAFVAVVACGEPGSTWVVQDGKEAEPYRFCGLPELPFGQALPGVELGS